MTALAAPRWEMKPFAELTTRELYALLAARAQVFVVEQNCAYLDIDGLDLRSIHLWAWAPETDEAPVLAPTKMGAYLRLLPPGLKYARHSSIGRVLTTSAVRGRGWGRALMVEGVRAACSLWPDHDIKIGAQAYLTEFYGELGFEICGPGFLEDGIPHVEMHRLRTHASHSPRS